MKREWSRSDDYGSERLFSGSIDDALASIEAAESEMQQGTGQVTGRLWADDQMKSIV